ncbi:MAG: YdcF family protein [Chitinivibrionales bacterium]|nr:YdcF family protein [Chitinivibrionales bacterium]
MIHVLSKFAVIPFYPLSLSILLGLFGVGFICFNKRKIAFFAVLISIGCLFFFSSPVVAHILTRGLESRYAPSFSYPSASAIVLLGGAEVAKLPPRIYNETNSHADRIMHAARLFKKGYAPFLVATGGQLAFVKEFPGSEAEISFSLLTELFEVDSSKILLDRNAKNTHDNALNVLDILRKHNLPATVILVTSALHLPRATAVFRKAGFTVFPAPTDYVEDTYFQPKVINFFPNARALMESTDALHEYYGIIGYKLIGWM